MITVGLDQSAHAVVIYPSPGPEMLACRPSFTSSPYPSPAATGGTGWVDFVSIGDEPEAPGPDGFDAPPVVPLELLAQLADVGIEDAPGTSQRGQISEEPTPRDDQIRPRREVLQQVEVGTSKGVV